MIKRKNKFCKFAKLSIPLKEDDLNLKVLFLSKLFVCAPKGSTVLIFFIENRGVPANDPIVLKIET